MKSNLLKLTIGSMIFGGLISGNAQAQNYWPQPESAYMPSMQSPQWIESTVSTPTAQYSQLQTPVAMTTQAMQYQAPARQYQQTNTLGNYPFPQTNTQPIQQTVQNTPAPAANRVQPPQPMAQPYHYMPPAGYPQYNPYGYQPQYYPQPYPPQYGTAYAPYGQAPYNAYPANNGWSNGWPNGNVIPFGNFGNMDMGHWKMPSMNNGPWNSGPWGNNGYGPNNNTPWNNWMPNMNDMSMPNFDMPSPSFSMPTMGMPGMPFMGW
ncbi:hypothetical protein J3998_02330 [Thiomicrorhabdus sp. 6S2-11]|jgi:hypothetical protein|uniref:Uncharacterized protein n=1 Tax=Thiomicrorhabdus marina TaxID=2818442 RepID=A0ABS3Q247_9GAMM|nr:hypothetical protein [Thiomicrorhabdus marina]MBO1926398.1 hypothetical protein [Thiomicrorhabdus marina]